MNLKLRRLVRTPHSEQFALYNLEVGEEPVSVGKVDLHFTPEGLFGTMLLWDESMTGWDDEELGTFIQGLIEDLIEPRGMPDVYVIEYFAPSLSTYRFFTNEEEE